MKENLYLYSFNTTEINIFLFALVVLVAFITRILKKFIIFIKNNNSYKENTFFINSKIFIK